MRFLLDTNVVCEAIRPRPDPRVLSWLTRNQLTTGLSAISLGEIWKGIQSLPKGRRKSNYIAWYREQEEEFQDRVIPIDAAVMKTWGDHCVRLKSEGVRPGAFDSLIAATALHHNLILATRNDADFPGVRLLNPWK